MRPIAPQRQEQSSSQEKQRAAGLVLLLAAVVAGVAIQIVFVPREAQAGHATRLASPESQIAAFGPPAPVAPRSNHDFLQTRVRPGSTRPSTRSRLGLAQPITRQPARQIPAAAPHKLPAPRAGRPGAIPRPQAEILPAPLAVEQAPHRPVVASPTETEPRPAPLEPADSTGPAAHEAPSDNDEPVQPRAIEPEQGEPRLAVLGPADAREGELVTFAISVEGVREIAHTPVRLTFDPQVLEFVEAEEGAMLASDGAPTRFQVGHGGGEGVIDVLVSRTQPGRGITGSGVLFTITFLAHAPGETPLLFAGSSLLDASGHRMKFQGEETALSVRP